MAYEMQLSYLVGNDSVNFREVMQSLQAAIAYIQLYISPRRYVSAFITSGDTSWLLTSDDGSELDCIRRDGMVTTQVRFPNPEPSLMQLDDVRTHQRRPRGEDHDGSMEPPPAKTVKFW
jgi:hypothetical protein